MNEENDCMIELEAHKAENSGQIGSAFIDYLDDKYGHETLSKCLAVIS